MSTTFTEVITLSKIDCGNCGSTYAINERYRREKEEIGGTWHCPYCQVCWGYVKSEADRLRAELEQKNIALTRAKCEALNERQEKEREQQISNRLRKRISKGVCPCCHRTVSQLARHMKSKHPDYPK